MTDPDILRQEDINWLIESGGILKDNVVAIKIILRDLDVIKKSLEKVEHNIYEKYEPMLNDFSKLGDKMIRKAKSISMRGSHKPKRTLSRKPKANKNSKR